MKIFLCVLALAFVASAEDLDFGSLSKNYIPNVDVKTITFTLYTRKHGDNGAQMFLGDKASITKAGFNPKLPVKVATHGYMADACGDSVQCLRKAFLAQADCNFISIDWSKYSKNVLYEESALAVWAVGAHVSKFLKFLRDETKINIKDVHVMGHSLGAHVMSFASNEFPKEKVGRISGFDPTGPIFEKLPPSDRLDDNDALFVDVIHTSTFYLGTRNPIGTVDYYPNGGNGQPGCDIADFQCQHNMAHRYFTYTVKNNKDYEAVKCNTVKDAENGTCTGDKAPMGIGANKAKPGIYYTKITKAPDSC